MVKLRIVFFVLLAGALLAGCSQMAAPGGAVEPQFISVPTPAPSPLTALAPSDGLAVEVLGTGLGSDGGPSTGSTVVIPDPDTVVSLYVQVVTKVSDGLPDAGLPDRVDVTTTGGSPTALSWAGTPADTLTKVEIVGGNGAHRTDGLGWSFEGVVAGPGTTSVSASVTGATDPYGPRALIVYVLRDAASGVGDSAGFPEVWSFGNDGVPSVERTLPLPSGFAGGDVSVTFAVSDLQNDVRYVRLEAEAGSASAGQSYDKPNRNDELLIASLTLHDVPAGAAEVTARVLTPAKQKGDATWGDSVFWDGVTLHAQSGDHRRPGLHPRVLEAAAPLRLLGRLRSGRRPRHGVRAAREADPAYRRQVDHGHAHAAAGAAGARRRRQRSRTSRRGRAPERVVFRGGLPVHRGAGPGHGEGGRRGGRRVGHEGSAGRRQRARLPAELICRSVHDGTLPRRRAVVRTLARR